MSFCFLVNNEHACVLFWYLSPFLQTWQISYTSFDTLNTRQCDDMSCKVCCLFRKAWCRQNTTKYMFSSHWLLLLQNRNPHWRCYICLTRRWHQLIIRHCQPPLSSLLQNVTFKALFSNTMSAIPSLLC